MTISPEAQRVREALLNKGLETPYFDTGKTPEEKMELIAGKIRTAFFPNSEGRGMIAPIPPCCCCC